MKPSLKTEFKPRMDRNPHDCCGAGRATSPKAPSVVGRAASPRAPRLARRSSPTPPASSPLGVSALMLFSLCIWETDSTDEPAHVWHRG